MGFRDLPYATSSVVYLIDGLADSTLAALPAALAAYLQDPGTREFRVRAGELRAAVAEATIELPPGLGHAALIARTRAEGFGRIPTRIVRSGGTIAIAVSHAVMDGGPIYEYVSWLVTVAAGGAGKRDQRVPVSFPLVRGLRAVGMDGVKAFRLERGLPRVPPPMTHRPTAADLALERVGMATIRLDPAVLSALAVTPGVTPSAQLVSVAIDALRGAYERDEDLPVEIPIDLRRHLGNRRVLGNFMGVASPSSLFASDWSAATVTDRLVASTSSGSAMVSAVYAFVRWAAFWPRDLLRRGGSTGGPGPRSIFFPLLGNRKRWPAAAWRDGAEPVVAVTSLDSWPSGTVVSMVRVGDRMHVTMWDETATFDAERFRAGFLAELQRRTTAAPPLSGASA